MKIRIVAALVGVLLLAAGSLPAQFYLGPALQAGMTYSKNIVIEDTSRYYIKNSPSLFAALGLETAYQIDTNIRVQLGVQGQYRSFNLVAPKDVDGLSFENIKGNTIMVSVPVTLNYRIPMSKGSNKYFNVMAGHGLDIAFKDDSLISNFPYAPVDSGGAFARHEYQWLTQGSFISSVLLGVGADFVSAKGNLLNVSLVWGISTRQLFRGTVREWSILHQNYDPTTTDVDPEEFPDHYYEWGLRGSNVSLRVSYYFNLSKKGEKEEGEGKKEKAEKPEKEKKPKGDDVTD